MELIANMRLARGRGVIVEPGDVFDEPYPRNVKMLVSTGKAREIKDDVPIAPVVYEVRTFQPEHKEPMLEAAPPPFCDVPVHHEEQAVMVAEGYRILPSADLPEPGVTHRRRRGRPRNASRSARR